MNVTRSLMSAVALAAALVAPLAHADESTPLDAAKHDLKLAAYDTPEAITKARAQLAALQAADPQSPNLHYWVALADYRLVPRLMSKNKKDADRYIKDGIDHLDRAIELNPKFADAIALKAGLQGLAIAVSPTRAMSLGSEIEESFGRAAGMEPSNPRIALLKGINTFSKPGFVGGGAKKALPMLLEAADLFAVEKAGDIGWGHDEAYTWAGRAAAKMDKTEDARTYYRKALELNPDNHWVEHVLLPALDKEKGKS